MEQWTYTAPINLKGDTTSRCRLGFWTCNIEDPLEPIAIINNEINVDFKQILASASIWGLIRTTVLEIDYQSFVSTPIFHCVERI